MKKRGPVLVRLILVRHGQSIWNEKNLFTGWEDVGLSEKGKAEARQAGLSLKKSKISIDQAFCSALKRSIHTLEILLEAMGEKIPFEKHWRLNERHYGALQGKNKDSARQEFGAMRVQEWRRSFETAPPPLEQEQSLEPKKLYKDLLTVPKTESLKDTGKRVLVFWNQRVLPLIKENKSVLISAHGNSLRALIKEIESVSDKEISLVELQTGRPIVYETTPSLKILRKKIL